jgi:hypothetical protein
LYRVEKTEQMALNLLSHRYPSLLPSALCTSRLPRKGHAFKSNLLRGTRGTLSPIPYGRGLNEGLALLEPRKRRLFSPGLSLKLRLALP